MGKYCCFFDPQYDYSEKRLTDKCPSCGRAYNYTLENKPSEITNDNKIYHVIDAIGRGFYAATYLCEIRKRFKTERVLLKVIPVELYDFFSKDFEAECEKHADVSENTEHLVKINDAFDTDIIFGTEKIRCHVAELEYINGQVLSEYIENPAHAEPIVFAQIAIDLIKLWNELVQKQEYHNDLHLDNIMVEDLGDSVRRIDAIYDKIRLVAIDLNSVADHSQSNIEKGRIGDRKYLANHIGLLVKKLFSKYDSNDQIPDQDYRLIETLNKIATILSVSPAAADIADASEYIDMIKEEFRSNISYSPWKKTLSLSRLNDKINAQTLSSCHVPLLLVDPDNSWTSRVCVSGPQLITGMRGCGKTMLLNALDIHARLTPPLRNKKNAMAQFDLDPFLGIFVTCKDLINVASNPNTLMVKLFLLYSIQVIRAARHMEDIEEGSVKIDFQKDVASTLSTVFNMDFSDSTTYSAIALERYLSATAMKLSGDNNEIVMHASVIDSFELLSDTINSISSHFRNKQIFFLFDDASTRYLSVEQISQLLTSVLFQSEKCAFKITTELQTLNFGFKSPGNIEMAHDMRDYQLFDLGANVYDRTKDSRTGKAFIEQIINKRRQFYSGLSSVPETLEDTIGDCSLSEIANSIIEHTSSRELKSVYHGATALASLCVGDIGDIISLYESIISNNVKASYPVPSEIQTKCFQQLCSRRMYNLERRDGLLRDYVKSFAEASHKALIDSYKALTRDGQESKRIRQYNSLYVRITSGNLEEQRERIRLIIDSGIFVFADGNGWPRTKSNDTDPTMQVKLAFRKLFGVSNFIGLANADRFELSGEALEMWLKTPSKDILLRNLGRVEDGHDYESSQHTDSVKRKQNVEVQIKDIAGSEQITLFDAIDKRDNHNTISESVMKTLVKNISQRVLFSTASSKTHIVTDVAVVGLGFEDRCVKSLERVLRERKFKKIVFVKYSEVGKTSQIKKLVNRVAPECETVDVDYYDIEKLEKETETYCNVLIDISGLSRVY